MGRGRNIRGVLAFLLLTLNFSFPQDIEKLLREYEEASELYRKTRRESLGHVIVFRREDLERMQAYRLGDLLKSLRYFTLSNNRFGVLSLFEFGAYSVIPKHYRLYINDHEVSSLHTGSPFLVWENFPLDLIEHVEIYQAPGAIELGNEPAIVIIKIYTKDPRRENVSRIRSTASSRKGYDLVFYRAEELGPETSYVFLLSAGSDNRKDYTLRGETLSRDAYYRYAFAGLYFPNVKLELGYGSVNRTPFLGFATDNVAEEGYTKAEDLYFVLTAYPLEDRSLKFVFSLDNHRRKHYESSSSGLFIPIFMDPLNPLNNPRDFYENTFFNKIDIYLSKTFTRRKNKLLTAVSYKLYNADVDSRYYTTLGGTRVNVGSTVPFNRQEIYSLILEDQFSLDPRNLLIGGVKLDKYYRNGGFKDFEEYILRVGYITTPRRGVYLKGFLSRSYIPPYFYDIEISRRDLDTIKIPLSATAEAIFSFGRTKVNVGGGYVRVKHSIAPDSSGLLRNLDEILEYRPVSLDVEHDISENHRIQLGYSFFVDPEVRLSPTAGGYLRLLSSFRRIHTFAELVYRRGFEYRGRRIEDGYDLSAGASYSVTDDLSVRIKGENLLNRAIRIPYLALQTGSVDAYPVRERTLYLSVDWVF